MSLSWHWTVKEYTNYNFWLRLRTIAYFFLFMNVLNLHWIFYLWERRGSQLQLWDCSIFRIISYFKYLRFLKRQRYAYWKDKGEKELWDKIVKRKTRKEIIKYKYSNLNVYFIESFIAVLSFLFRSDNCFVQQCCESIFDLFD